MLLLDFFNELVTKNPNMESMLPSKNNFLVFLGLIQILFFSLVFILFIFLTHKIAGPMYKLKNHLQNIREGGDFRPLTFRKGDYFPDVAEEVSLFLETIAEREQNDLAYLDEVSIYIDNLNSVIPDDKRPVLNEISRRLTEIKSRYKNLQ